jgi:ParB family transcriptional regulator, chromosome partitioning protein
MSARKRGLGRGLDALLKVAPPVAEPGGTDAAPKGGSALEVPIDQLQPNRFQPRTSVDDEGIQELADSIKAQGVVQPIVVSVGEDGGYRIIAGERRWRASRRAGLESVPVVVREVSGDQELLELALVENLQRRDLNPVEEAEAYRSLGQTFGLSQDEIAKRVGKARTTVTNGLRLLRLPREVQDHLRSGQLTPGQARPLLRLPSERQQVELARQAVEKGLTARQLERYSQAAEAAPDRAAKEPDPLEVHAVAAAEKLTKHLQTQVRIKRKGKGGVVAIRFHSEEELIRIFDLLMARGDKE